MLYTSDNQFGFKPKHRTEETMYLHTKGVYRSLP